MPVKISPTIKRKRYGLEAVSHGLEGLILNSRFLEDRFYQLWLGLSTTNKKLFLAQVRTLIKKELLGQEFLKALAKDIIHEGEINTRSNIYQYIKKRYYHGSSRLFLSELQDILTEKVEEKNYRIPVISTKLRQKPSWSRVRKLERSTENNGT